MNYRHAFHAGNFADVVKHVVLVAILLHLRKKEKPFRVIDTHAGCGFYDLSGEHAQRTREFETGVARLENLSAAADLPAALRTYLDVVRGCGPLRYPGSPFIAAKLLREKDRLVAIERQPDEAARLAATLSAFKGAKAIEGDGYKLLPSLLPPPERRGLVLFDPPFEAADEFVQLAASLAAARRRFATGQYLVWFPVKSAAQCDAFCSEVLAQGVDEVLKIVVDRGGQERGDGKARLAASGLAIVNPPYGLAAEMRAAAARLAPVLGAAASAEFEVEAMHA